VDDLGFYVDFTNVQRESVPLVSVRAAQAQPGDVPRRGRANQSDDLGFSVSPPVRGVTMSTHDDDPATTR
jgi:hypothetical protein